MKRSLDHNRFMARAISLSIDHVKQGEGGPFGAVIVKDNDIIAEGVNLVTQTNDPTAHAEIVAIRAACSKLNDFQLTGCTLYTSCEPCPMCLGAIYWARLETIFFGNTKIDAAYIGFDDSFIYKELKLTLEYRSIPMIQLMRDEAQEAFILWCSSYKKIPY